jgi:hypothetical protein
MGFSPVNFQMRRTKSKLVRTAGRDMWLTSFYTH